MIATISDLQAKYGSSFEKLSASDRSYVTGIIFLHLSRITNPSRIPKVDTVEYIADAIDNYVMIVTDTARDCLKDIVAANLDPQGMFNLCIKLVGVQ